MPSPISQQLSPPPILKEGSVEDTPSSNESLESAALRFQVELEFVQALANTDYLRYLAQSGYLSQEPFQNYISYLNYWRKPEYAKYLIYPYCLEILTLLSHQEFRDALMNPDNGTFIHSKFAAHWATYRNGREKEKKEQKEEKEVKNGNAGDVDAMDVS